MKIICAWCQRDGKPSLLGEKSPLTNQTETHSICWEHLERLRTTKERDAIFRTKFGSEPVEMAG